MNIESIEGKAKLLGLNTIKFGRYNNECILVSKSNMEHTLYIPEAAVWKNDSDFKDIKEHIQNRLKGCLNVVGGHGLVSISHLFDSTILQLINVANMNTQNVQDMSYAFANCKAKIHGLETLNVSNVKTMQSMFCYYDRRQSLDLSKWDTRNLQNAMSIFEHAYLDKLDISNWNTSNLLEFTHAFSNCTVKKFVNNGLDLSKIDELVGLFKLALLDKLDLRNWKFNKNGKFEFMLISTIVDEIYLINDDLLESEANYYLINLSRIHKLITTKDFMDESEQYCRMTSSCTILDINIVEK